jgi:hypothetical protein
VTTAYDYTGLHPGNKRTPWHGVAQVRNEQRLPGRVARVQGPSGDQVGLGQGPHAHTVSAQVGAMATFQGGQGGKQTHLLTRN